MALRFGERGRAAWVVVYRDGKKTDAMPKKSALDFMNIFAGRYIKNIKTGQEIYNKNEKK